MPVKAAVISYEHINQLFLSQMHIKSIEQTRAFIMGDHWQGKAGWVGWQPATGSDTAVKDWEIIERGFTPKNVIRGMVKRLEGAVFGKEPDWEVVSTKPADIKPEPLIVDPLKPQPKPPQKDPAMKAMDDALALWWQKKRVHETLKKFLAYKAAYGKAMLRIYIPAGFVEGTEDQYNITATDLADALDKIFVEVPEPESIAEDLDIEYGQVYTAIAQKRLDSFGMPTADIFYELSYVETDGLTHIRQVSQSDATSTDNKQVAESSTFDTEIDLNGNLLMFVDGEWNDAMVSPTIKAQQKQLNHANTMEGYSMANINFPPVYFTNAVTDVDTKDPATGKTIQKKAGLIAGFGQWVNLIGQAISKVDGSEDLKTPTITFQPTGKPEDFAKVAMNKARDMHEEAGMLYVFLTDSPYPSGNARLEAMTDYIILLVDYKTLCDKLGTWLLDTVLRMALNLTGQIETQKDTFKVIFSTKLTVGRLSVEDKKHMLNEVNSGLRSKRNYLITAEVTDDPDSELKVISTDPPTPGPILGFSSTGDPITKPQPSGGNPPAPGNGNGNKPKPAPAPAAT